MSGSDFIAFQELTARVEALEATVLRLQERVEGKDMMPELGLAPSEVNDQARAAMSEQRRKKDADNG